MSDRDQRRAAMAPAIAKVIRQRDFRATLAAAADGDGGLTVICVLPDDPMSYVFDMLREAAGRAVVALEADGLSPMAVVCPASAARVEVAGEDDDIALIHRDSDAAMFFDYLAQRKTLVVQELVAHLMPGADLQPA